MRTQTQQVGSRGGTECVSFTCLHWLHEIVEEGVVKDLMKLPAKAQQAKLDFSEEKPVSQLTSE